MDIQAVCFSLLISDNTSLGLFTNAQTTHSQDNDRGDERTPVESSSATVNGGRLLLVHLPTTVATAATAHQEEANDGHQNDVHDTNCCTYQETHFIHQGLNTENTHTQVACITMKTA